MLRCADQSFYVGITQDLDARLKAHNDGRGTAYTFKRRPVSLVYSER
ncbi:MAG: GIY-YIG nuclease family protein [Nitrospirota bacterium]